MLTPSGRADIPGCRPCSVYRGAVIRQASQFRFAAEAFQEKIGQRADFPGYR